VAAVPAPPPGGLRGAIDLAPLVARQNQQAAAHAHADPAAPAGDAPAGMPGVVVEIGDAEFPRLIELSRTVPVVVALVATWSTPSQELVTSLRRVVESAAGRLVLAIVDSDSSPQVVSAFQAESIPTVVAVIAGSPVPLFAGLLPEDRMVPLFEQVLELAVQNGVTGTVPGVEADAAAPAEPEPEPLPPLHQEAYAAIEEQDYAEAARLFRTAIAQDPRDSAAVAALAQVELLDRLRTVPDDARTAAADDPKDVAAALAVADLDVAGGHVDDAFDRLLEVFATASGDDRTAIRTRLLDFFALTGTDDPRVAAARRRLATLLY
jgi:putative thioredoxin